MEIRATDSPDQKKVDFGPRVKFSKPVAQESKENLAGSSVNRVSTVTQAPRRGSVDLTAEQTTSSLAMKLDIANSRIAQLERERDEWKQRAEAAIANSEGSLGDMLVEIELETLREEVSRLRAHSTETPNHENSELASLRLRCAELETQVNNLRKDKVVLERKNKDERNAEISKIRVLQEQISNEKRMRERIANTESSLPVVTVGMSQSIISSNNDGQQTVVTARPRAASPAVPSFVVESVKRPPVIDPRTLDKTTVVLPAMGRSMVSGYDALGDDPIADQWRQCLADRPESYKALVSRQPGTNIFTFGAHRVACKKIGNHTMIQVGRETMLLEKFIETCGPQENGQSGSTPKAGPAKSSSSGITLKSITASKHALASKQSSN